MYFKVSASLVDAQQFSGQRKYVFSIAAENLALYDANLPSTSIFYNGTSKSLSVSLWFRDENHAQAFLTKLSILKLHNDKKMNVEFESDIIRVVSANQASPVLPHHYVKGDSPSPENSHVNSIAMVTELPYQPSDPLTRLCSLESFLSLAYKERIARCHIAPKAHYKRHASDSSNILFGSYLFHQYLTGMGRDVRQTQT